MQHAIRLAMVGTVLLGTGTQAQGWARQPDGNYGYQFDYTTSASFYCGDAHYLSVLMGVTCTSNGSSVSFTHTGGSYSIGFQGVSATALAIPVGAGRMPIGTFSSHMSGPFTFSTFPNIPIFWLAMTVTTVSPAVSSGSWYGGYTGGPATQMPFNCCDGSTTGNGPVYVGTSPEPPATAYNLVLSEFTPPTFPLYDADVSVDAVASLNPEPATLGFVVPALLGIALVRRRHRR